ncbi:MAG: hypothetical protein SGI72_14830 [Planctomycetota bacterium]|nr:hypothetical protein [Planctomycetota bacterium]
MSSSLRPADLSSSGFGASYAKERTTPIVPMRVFANENTISPGATSRMNSENGFRSPFDFRFGDEMYPPAISSCPVWFWLTHP